MISCSCQGLTSSVVLKPSKPPSARLPGRIAQTLADADAATYSLLFAALYAFKPGSDVIFRLADQRQPDAAGVVEQGVITPLMLGMRMDVGVEKDAGQARHASRRQDSTVAVEQGAQQMCSSKFIPLFYSLLTLPDHSATLQWSYVYPDSQVFRPKSLAQVDSASHSGTGARGCSGLRRFCLLVCQIRALTWPGPRPYSPDQIRRLPKNSIVHLTARSRLHRPPLWYARSWCR